MPLRRSARLLLLGQPFVWWQGEAQLAGDGGALSQLRRVLAAAAAASRARPLEIPAQHALHSLAAAKDISDAEWAEVQGILGSMAATKGRPNVPGGWKDAFEYMPVHLKVGSPRRCR